MYRSMNIESVSNLRSISVLIMFVMIFDRQILFFIIILIYFFTSYRNISSWLWARRKTRTEIRFPCLWLTPWRLRIHRNASPKYQFFACPRTAIRFVEICNIVKRVRHIIYVDCIGGICDFFFF